MKLRRFLTQGENLDIQVRQTNLVAPDHVTKKV